MTTQWRPSPASGQATPGAGGGRTSPFELML